MDPITTTPAQNAAAYAATIINQYNLLINADKATADATKRRRNANLTLANAMSMLPDGVAASDLQTALGDNYATIQTALSTIGNT